MTTENTDAGIRILTRTIRKLTARLAIADAAVDQKQKVINDRANEIDAARVVLDPPSGRMPTWEREFMADPLCKLAEKRMAELATERKTTAELRPLVDRYREDVAMLKDRIDSALAVLPSSIAAEVDFAPIAEARRILRGEA